MFRPFQKPKRIDLTCPYCFHSQLEPSIVISSFCRHCGEHFRVEKGVALPGSGPQVSGIVGVRDADGKAIAEAPVDPSPEPESAPADDAWMVDGDDRKAVRRPLSTGAPTPPGKAAGISAGAFFGLVEQGEPSETRRPKAGGNGPARLPLDAGTVGALIEEQAVPAPPEKDKMPPNYLPSTGKKNSGAPRTDFEVRCFRCHHRQLVSRFAKSTQCDRCSVYISLADYEIREPKRHSLRTRGNIVITRRGGLYDSEIACHDLTVRGTIDARVDCTGEAVFKHSGVVRGSLHCRRLVVEKHCEVEFPDGILADGVEAYGRLVGDVTSSGTVCIRPGGEIAGDIRAVEVEIREGGTHSGESTIDPETSTDLPSKAGFNATVIG